MLIRRNAVFNNNSKSRSRSKVRNYCFKNYMADFQQESFEVDIFELVRPNQIAIQLFNKTNA